MPKKKRQVTAHPVAKVPEGAKLVHEDDNNRVYVTVKGEMFLVRLEYVTYRMRGPRA